MHVVYSLLDFTCYSKFLYVLGTIGCAAQEQEREWLT